jgi:hypothetical protein
MPSGRNGRDSEPETPIARPASGGPPSSGPSQAQRGADVPSGIRPPNSSARPPSEHLTWGAVLDAITAIHNFELLLKSPRVATKLLAEVLPEFMDGVSALRGAFLKAGESGKDEAALVARRALAEFTGARLDDLERTIQQAMANDFDARVRLALEQVVTRVSADLDVAAELLDLSERAEHALGTELTLEELARVVLRGGARGAELEVRVRLVERLEEHEPLKPLKPTEERGSEDGCVLRVDPHVFKRLVGFVIARVHACGGDDVSVRIRCGAASALIEVGPTTEVERSLDPTTLRLVRAVAPTNAIVDAAARSAGIPMTAHPASATVLLEVARVGQ